MASDSLVQSRSLLLYDTALPRGRSQPPALVRCTDPRYVEIYDVTAPRARERDATPWPARSVPLRSWHTFLPP